MNLLLNSDIWLVINKYNEGTTTYHNYSSHLRFIIKKEYVGIIKNNFINDVRIDDILYAMYNDCYKVVEWYCDLYPEECFPEIELSKLTSLRILEYIYPRIEDIILDISTVIIPMIWDREQMKIVNFWYDKGWCIKSKMLSLYIRDILLNQPGIPVLYETFIFLQRYHQKIITHTIVSRLENTPETARLIHEDPFVMKKIFDNSDSDEPFLDVYKIDSTNLEILKMYHDRYPISKSHFWKNYHMAICNDKLDVVKWLWEIGVTFRKNKMVKIYGPLILDVCRKVLCNTSHETINWLMEQPSFAKFIRKSNITLKATVFFVTNNSDTTQIVRRLRLVNSCGVKLIHISKAVESSPSIMINIMLLRQSQKQHMNLEIYSNKNDAMWFFRLKYMYHFHYSDFLAGTGEDKKPKWYKLAWIPEKYLTMVNPLIVFCNIVIQNMTNKLEANYERTLMRWYYYNVFRPFCEEEFPGLQTEDIRIGVSQKFTHQLFLHQYFFPILCNLLKVSNNEFIIKKLVLYLSLSAVLSSSLLVLEYYAKHESFDYYTIIPFVVQTGDDTMVKAILDRAPNMIDYMIGYLNGVVNYYQFRRKITVLCEKLNEYDDRFRGRLFSLDDLDMNRDFREKY